MALGAEVVDLVGADLFHQRRRGSTVGEVGVMQVEPFADDRVAGRQVVDPLPVQVLERRTRPWTS